MRNAVVTYPKALSTSTMNVCQLSQRPSCRNNTRLNALGTYRLVLHASNTSIVEDLSSFPGEMHHLMKIFQMDSWKNWPPKGAKQLKKMRKRRKKRKKRREKRGKERREGNANNSDRHASRIMAVLLAFACRAAANGHFGMLRANILPSNWAKLLTKMQQSSKKWMKSMPKWLRERADEENFQCECWTAGWNSRGGNVCKRCGNPQVGCQHVMDRSRTIRESNHRHFGPWRRSPGSWC